MASKKTLRILKGEAAFLLSTLDFKEDFMKGSMTKSMLEGTGLDDF